MVGFDGIVEYNGASADLELEQPLESGAACVFNLRLIKPPVPGAPISPAVCSIRLPEELVERTGAPGRTKGASRRIPPRDNTRGKGQSAERTRH